MTSISRLLNFNYGIAWLFILLQMSPLPHATAQNGPAQQQDAFTGLNGIIDKRMAYIMIILVTIFFVLGVMSVYMRRCTDHRIRGHLDLAMAVGGSNRRGRLSRGLDAATIGTFPTFMYSSVKGLKIGKGSLECAVCLNEFEENDERLRLLPKCSHVFHADCIDAWLASHTTCPVCRANLVPMPGEIHSTVVQILNPDNDSGQPDHRSDADATQVPACVADNQSGDIESPNVNLVNNGRRTNQNRPVRSRSTGFTLAGIFPRSHSTGHSLQRGENHERFTLRLPDELRSRLMNSTLNRANSCVAFPRVRSSRRGYRSASGGSGRGRNYLFGRSDRWRLSLTPTFISRPGSVRSPKLEMDFAGERSSDPLRPYDQT